MGRIPGARGQDRSCVELVSRNGKDLTRDYPTIVAAIGDLKTADVVVDGEIVALDGDGRPSFQALQQPAPSLRTPRLLRRHQQYYEQVRLPTSARRVASVFPRDTSPSATMPTAPVGSPGSRR